jgi:TPR repeat protein
MADTGRRRLGVWLFGTDQERALREAADAAIEATARQIHAGPATADDPQDAEYLAQVIDQVFQQPPMPAESLAGYPTLLQGLQAEVGARLAVLADRQRTGVGKSSAELLGVSVPMLTDRLTGHLLHELLARGAGGGPLAALADQLNHDRTFLQGQQLSSQLNQLLQDLQATSPTPPLARPVGELTDPFALEVHRAIDIPGATASLPALTPYVERAHDRQLRGLVSQAAHGRSVAAVLVGGSSTGKTRACWEAVKTLPYDWRLWHPIDPSRPEAAAEALPVVGRRTVIWLNEAQHYLLTPASGLGERVAAGLRELLRNPDRGPVLLLATIWPEYWATLTADPDPEQHDDPHAQARELLTGTNIAVPSAFTGPTLEAVKAAAKADPRLAEAARQADDGRITQFLAGAPALMDRYRNAPAAARALIDGAVDARRLDHGLYLPRSLLEAAAPAYLTDQEWDELGPNWLEQALAYCAVPCRGARGPLTLVRPRPGQPAPAQPHYRLADYLEQTGRAMRRSVLAPAGMWDALVKQASERDLPQIAQEADWRSLYSHSIRLYQRAAEAGEQDALAEAARLLKTNGQLEEAIDWLKTRAEAGNRYALEQAARLLEDQDRTDESIDWLQARAEAGDPYALAHATGLLEEAGRLDEAIDWLRSRAEAGDPNALGQATRLLERADRNAEAIEWYQRAAEAGDQDAVAHAARVMERTGRTRKAINWYKRAAEAGDLDAFWHVIGLLERTGRTEEAIDWLQFRTAVGHPYALNRLTTLLEETGQLDAAIYWLKSQTGADDYSVTHLTRLLEKAGRLDEAMDCLQVYVDASPTRELEMGWFLERTGRNEQAIACYKRAAEAGNTDALAHAARLLEQTGRTEEGAQLRLRGLEPGSGIVGQ